MTEKLSLNRRNFLKQAAGTVGAVTQAPHWAAVTSAQETQGEEARSRAAEDLNYPRKFRERQLQMISFPLGGVAAGSIGLGGARTTP